MRATPDASTRPEFGNAGRWRQAGCLSYEIRAFRVNAELRTKRRTRLLYVTNALMRRCHLDQWTRMSPASSASGLSHYTSERNSFHGFPNRSNDSSTALGSFSRQFDLLGKCINKRIQLFRLFPRPRNVKHFSSTSVPETQKLNLAISRCRQDKPRKSYTSHQNHGVICECHLEATN